MTIEIRIAETGNVKYAREMAKGLCVPFRAPHHTASAHTMAEEVALAAGGVLLLDEAQAFSSGAIAVVLRLHRMMAEKMAPTVIVSVRPKVLESAPMRAQMKHCFEQRWIDAVEAFHAPKPENPDLAMPEGLSDRGQRAYHAIMKVLTKVGATYTGGCKAFYSPQEWRDRGEEYGRESELVVVYDGGDLGPFFRIGVDDQYASMCDALRSIGLYAEECTHWYAAVYP